MDEIDRVSMEKEKVERYLMAEADYRSRRDSSTALKVLKSIPYPSKIITILLVFLVGGLYVKYGPYAIDFIIQEWVQAESTKNIFMISMMTNIVLLAILAITYMLAHEVIRPWLKAGIMKKPILLSYTKNRTIEFKVPKEFNMDMWTVNDKMAVVPDPEAIVPGPHRVPIMTSVPELAFGFYPRNLLRGLPLNIDMSSVKNYAIEHKQREADRKRDGLDFIKPFIMPLIMLLAISLVLGPFFYQKMNTMDEGERWRGQYEQCRVQMLDAGVTPPDLQQSKADQPEDKTQPKPASTGGGVIHNTDE